MDLKRGPGAAADGRAGALEPRLSPVAVGRLAVLAAVAVWSTWLVATRYGVSTTLAPLDVAMIRFAVSGAVLWPFLRRGGWGLRPGERLTTVVMVAGAGAPFFLIAAAGMRLAPTSHIAALLPGTVPLFTAILAAAFGGDRPDRGRLAGLALIVVGIGLIGGPGLVGAASAGDWRGHGLLLLGATMWGGYIVAMRHKATGTWRAAAIVNVWSAVLLLPVYLLVAGGGLLDAPWRDVAIQAVVQGLLSGVVAMALFGVAVGRLGAARAAAFTALLPVLATVLAIPLLGEVPDAPSVAGIAAASAGVLLAAGIAGASRLARGG